MLAFILLSGCASLNPSMGVIKFGATDTWERNTIDGVYLTDTLVIIPLGSKFSNEDDMALKVGRIKNPNNIVSYFFRAEVHSIDWIFAEYIATKVDDKIYRMHDESPNRDVLGGHYIMETLTFPISSEMIDNINESNSFSAELYKRVVTLEPYQLDKLKEFINEPF